MGNPLGRRSVKSSPLPRVDERQLWPHIAIGGTKSDTRPLGVVPFGDDAKHAPTVPSIIAITPNPKKYALPTFCLNLLMSMLPF